MQREVRRDQQEAPFLGGALSKRMKGLEPSTFCMASRRSSQLSYIREAAKYSRGFSRAQKSCGPPERAAAVKPHVMLA